MKLLLHCGSSKNGSTALQSVLSKAASSLAQKGIGVLSISYPAKTAFGQISLGECELHARDCFALNNWDDLRTDTSIAELYEIYKKARLRRDGVSLRAIELRICAALDLFEERGFHTLVASSEAFETSLCLRDGFFLRLIQKLSRKHDIRLIYYSPNPHVHVLRSWAQWGYIERFSYSRWLQSCLTMITPESFYSGREASYWANLFNIESWSEYWKSRTCLSLQIYSDVVDVSDHFFGRVLLQPQKVYLMPQELNMGWPKKYYWALPLFFDFLSGDYTKYEVIRQLLIDNCMVSGDQDMAIYNRLLRLTELAFATVPCSRSGGVAPNWPRSLEMIFHLLDDVFEESGQSALSELTSIMANAFYFYHEKEFSLGDKG